MVDSKIIVAVILLIILLMLLVFAIVSPTALDGEEWTEDRLMREDNEDSDACVDDYRTTYWDCIERQQQKRRSK